MKRLVILVVIGIAVWIAWKRGPNVFDKLPEHDVVVKNQGTAAIERLRVTVAGRTFVRETLAIGEAVAWPFRTENDSDFQLVWEFKSRMGEKRWTGGRVARGPLVQTHRLRIDDDGALLRCQFFGVVALAQRAGVRSAVQAGCRHRRQLDGGARRDDR